jgi:hypothetical protein
MMIRMNRAIFPWRALEGLFRQRPEMGQLFRPEHFIGSSLRGPVDLHADFFLAPPQSPPIELVNVSEGAPCKKMPSALSR